jgi:hypothetical protein
VRFEFVTAMDMKIPAFFSVVWCGVVLVGLILNSFVTFLNVDPKSCKDYYYYSYYYYYYYYYYYRLFSQAFYSL